MKRGGMRNIPAIKKSSDDLDVKNPENPVSPTPAVNALANAVNGKSITLPVRGRPVKFTLEVIPAERVARKTEVWVENERIQDFLTESALDDLIPSFVASGQQNPAFGRNVNGVVEIADGSRRRMTAILTGKEYRVLVGDLDEEQMAWLSQTGNNYRQTSAYERGRRYARLLEQKHDHNVSSLAQAENIDRKIIMRCINTSELPLEVIQLFAHPGELSARAGDELHKVFEEHKDAAMKRVEQLAAYKKHGDKLEADFIVKTLKGAVGAPEKVKPEVRSFGAGITGRYRGNDVEFTLKGASEALIKEIEAILNEATREK